MTFDSLAVFSTTVLSVGSSFMPLAAMDRTMSIQEPVKVYLTMQVDISKQLLTLAAGSLTLTVTFAKELIGHAKRTRRLLLATAWTAYLFSLIGGIWCLLSANGVVASIVKYSPNAAHQAIKAEKPILPLSIQLCCFLIGTVLILLIGLRTLLQFGESATTGTASSIPDKCESGVERARRRIHVFGREVEKLGHGVYALRSRIEKLRRKV
jgi:hypothetical protein